MNKILLMVLFSLRAGWLVSAITRRCASQADAKLSRRRNHISHIKGCDEPFDVDPTRASDLKRLGGDIKPTPENLLESWVRFESRLHGKTIKQALDDLRLATGVRATHGRLSEWRNLHRSPPPAAARYMVRKVVVEVLAETGLNARSLNDEAVERIAERLSLPERI
jgi:hypothetical protein